MLWCYTAKEVIIVAFGSFLVIIMAFGSSLVIIMALEAPWCLWELPDWIIETCTLEWAWTTNTQYSMWKIMLNK